MPVTTYNLIEHRGSQDDKNVRNYTLVYQAFCDSKSDSVVSVLSAFPNGFSVYGPDPLCTLKRREASQNKAEENSSVWTVTLEYSSDTGDPADSQDDPLDEPTKWSRITSKGEIPFTEDILGDAVVNAAGDAFDPPIMIDDSKTIFRAVKNYPGFDDNQVEGYVNTTNSATFLGKAAGLLRCSSIDVEKAFKNNVAYYVYTFEFEYDRNGWAVTPLNEGYYAIDLTQEDSAGDPLKYRVLDEDGQPLQTTTKLTADGVKIAYDALPAAAVYLEFVAYEETDFNDFGL